MGEGWFQAAGERGRGFAILMRKLLALTGAAGSDGELWPGEGRHDVGYPGARVHANGCVADGNLRGRCTGCFHVGKTTCSATTDARRLRYHVESQARCVKYSQGVFKGAAAFCRCLCCLLLALMQTPLWLSKAFRRSAVVRSGVYRGRSLLTKALKTAKETLIPMISVRGQAL